MKKYINSGQMECVIDFEIQWKNVFESINGKTDEIRFIFFSWLTLCSMFVSKTRKKALHICKR